MRARTVSLLVAVVVVLAGGVTVVIVRAGDSGSADTATADYCNAVAAKQSQISSIANSGDDRTALIDGLPVFQELASSAPPDISAQWMTVNSAIVALKSAIAATGHTPSEFANGTFPRGLTEAQRTAVVAAADTLGSTTTSGALSAIVQEVRDVCQVDLDL